MSYLNIPLIRIIVLIAMSLVFKALLPPKTRDSIVPWCFALLLLNGNMVPFTSGITHFLLLCFYFVSMSILLDGFDVNLFRRNKVLTAFFWFWGCLTVTSFWSEDIYWGVCYWFGALLELLMVGYFAGMWAMRTPDGLRKLLMPTVYLWPISLLFYIKSGFAVALDSAGRGAIDAELIEQGMGNNVNDVGLALDAIIAVGVVLLLMLMVYRHYVSRNGWRRLFIIFAVVTATYLLIRTGSRNASLAIFPCLYFAYKTTTMKKKAKVFFMLGAICLILIVLVKTFMLSETTQIRSFTLMESGGEFDINQATSGRWGEFEGYLSNMKGAESIIGKGLLFYDNPENKGLKVVGGALSVYVNVIVYAGFIGLFFMIIYYTVQWREGARHGFYGQVAILFFSVWAITGLGESQGLRRGAGLRLLQGVSLALCSNLRFRSTEYDNYCYMT